MAGGTAADIRAPYPKGDNSLFLIEFGSFEIIASKSADFVVDQFTLPFACRPVKAEITAQDINVSNAITVNIEDDTSSAKQIVTDNAVAAITAGEGMNVALTVLNKGTTLNAGAVLICSYASGASDTGVDVKIRLWVRPVF